MAAGEKSGELARVMNQLADYLDCSDALRTKTLQALLYPAIVAGVALLVIVGLMTYVVPQVVSVFQQGGQALPLLTRALIVVSTLLREWGWLMVLAIAGGLLAGRAVLRDRSVKRRWDAWLLRACRCSAATCARSTPPALPAPCRSSPGSGVPLLAAPRRRPPGDRRLLAEAVATAAERVREGQPLSRALGASRQFPPLLIHMIANGEATGRVDELLDRAARLQQAELETAPPPSPRSSSWVLLGDGRLRVAHRDGGDAADHRNQHPDEIRNRHATHRPPARLFQLRASPLIEAMVVIVDPRRRCRPRRAPAS